MNKNTCLNCKYEPEWSNWAGGEYMRCVGNCQCPVGIPKILPKTYRIHNDTITRYIDDSGVIENCPAWQGKN